MGNWEPDDEQELLSGTCAKELGCDMGDSAGQPEPQHNIEDQEDLQSEVLRSVGINFQSHEQLVAKC